MADRTVVIKVTDQGLSETTKKAEKLNSTLDQAAQPRKVRAASAALSTSAPIGTVDTGLTRGTAGTQTRGDARDFGRQAQGLGGLVHLYATFAANIYAVSAAFNAMSKAADFSNMQKAADILSLKVGTSINSLAKDMQKVTDGAISMSDALSAASLASSAGLNTKQIKELTTVAKGASIALGRDMTDAMTRVFRGTIKIEPELLDELGLMVKVDDANKAYAKTLNKTISSLTDYERRQAFVNAVTEQGVRKYKELAEQSANPFSKLAASLKDLSTSVLVTMNNTLGPIASLLSQSPVALLLGMTALVSLLLKQAVPAIGNMQAAWAASDKAAQDSLAKQRSALEAQKKVVLDYNNNIVKSAQERFVAVRELALKELQDSGVTKRKGIKQVSQLSNFIGLSPEEVQKNTELVKNELQKARKSIETEISKTQQLLNSLGKKTSNRYLEADKNLTKLQNQLSAVNKFETDGLKAISGAVAAQALAQKNLMSTDTEITSLTQKIGKFEQMGQRLAVIRGAVQATEAGGFRLGFADLFDSIKKGTGTFDEFGNVVKGTERNFSLLEKANIGLKGSFQVLTVGVSRLLSSFSIWMAVFTVLIPLLGMLTDKLGLTNDKLSKLTETTDKLAESTKLYSDIQDKLAKSSSISETFELNASSARAYADTLELIAERTKNLKIFAEQKGLSGTLDKASQGLQAVLFSTGEFGRANNMPTAKLFDEQMRTDSKFAAANANLLPKGMTAQQVIDAPVGLQNVDARATFIYEMLNALTNPAAVKASKEYADSSIAMKNNLKDLDTISSDYLITLQNQSKHLKALNALSASTSNLFKQLSSPRGGIANISEYLKGITNQFQEMSKVKLEPKLELLKTTLAENEKTINAEYDKDIANSKGRPELTALAEFNRTNSTNKSAEQAAIKAGYKDLKDATISLTKYSLDVVNSLADLASASASASVAQAKLSYDLKKTQFIASLSGASTKAAEFAAEKRKVDIENRARQTNIDSLQAQLNLQKTMLQSSLGTTSSSIEELKALGTEKLLSRDTTNQDRSTIFNSLSSLIATNSAITITKADINAANFSLSSALEARLSSFVDNLEKGEANATSLMNFDREANINKIGENFKGRVGVGSEATDAQYAYEVALSNSNTEIILASEALKNFDAKLQNLRLEYNKAKPEDKVGLERAIKFKEIERPAVEAKIDAAKREKEATEVKFNEENQLRVIRESNALELQSLELKKLYGDISEEDLNIKRIQLDLQEKTYILENAAFLTQDATLLKELAYQKSLAEGKLLMESRTKELRIQADTLANIEGLFSSNKISTGLLEAGQIGLMAEAYADILLDQLKIDQKKIESLPTNEKIIAQEALRVKYAQKLLELEESILDAREKASKPYEMNMDDLAKRYDIEAKKFRDSINNSYSKATVNASFAAVDVFVDGIVNGVKNLKFDVKSIIRDTIFAFDDMMMQYAAEQVKAMMKETIAGIFNKPDMFKTKAEIMAKEQADNIKLLKQEAKEKHTPKFDKMIELLEKIANKDQGGQNKSVSDMNEGSLQQLDYNFTEQGSMLASQTAGFTPAELFDWGGATQADIIAAQNAEFGIFSSGASDISSASTDFFSSVKTFGTNINDFTTGFGGYIDSFGEIAKTMGSDLMNFTSSLFSMGSSSGGGGIGGVLNSFMGMLGGGGGGSSITSSSMFATQEAGFSVAELANWGGSMTGFATGGDFKVGGQGATDSKLVQFMATPGEQVIVKTPEQQKDSGGGNNVTVTNNFTIQGNVSRESQQQISTKVGLSIQRAMARNN